MMKIISAIRPISPWRALFRRALVSGGAAAVASATVAAQCARAEGTTAAAPMNAVTHSVWPREGARATRPSLRHTVTGFAIHTCASIFWATGFEALRARQAKPTLADDLATAALVSAAAWCVDYHVVPARLTPGFEEHLGDRSMLLVYGAIAAGFLAAARIQRRSASA